MSAPYVMVVTYGGPRDEPTMDIRRAGFVGQTILAADITEGARSLRLTLQDGLMVEIVATSNDESLTDMIDRVGS